MLRIPDHRVPQLGTDRELGRAGRQFGASRGGQVEALDSDRLIEADGHEDRQGAVSVRVTDGHRRNRIVQTEGELAAGAERLQEERAVHPDDQRVGVAG